MPSVDDRKETQESIIGNQIRRRLTSSGYMTFGDTADLCTETVDGASIVLDKIDTENARLLLAGGVAGCIGKTITAPLSRLTILFQVHSMVSNAKNEQFSHSLLGGCKKVLRNEGLLAFWKGNGTSIIHRFPYSAINFLTYEKVKKQFENESQLMPWCRFISGATAGATATITCYPLDLIRTRLATQQDVNIRYRGISHAIHRICIEEGARGLYRGLGTTLLVTVPNLAINFTIYGTLKDLMASGNESNDKVAVAESLFCGAVAGITSSVMTFPIDVVRRRLQLQGIHHGSERIISASHIALHLFREQGIIGFYRGIVPELIKVVPMVGITFVAFEQLKASLDFDDQL